MNNVFIALGLAAVLFGGWYAYDALSGGREKAASLSGTVAYRERMALPEGSVIEVQIRDVSLADAPAEVVAQTSITTAGEQVPVPFTVWYDIADIEPGRTYAVFARILL